jgi:hypothetical protein
MGVGAYLKTGFSSTVTAIRQNSLHLGHWPFLLGGLVGSLMLCPAVTANQLPSHVFSEATLSQSGAVEDGIYLYGSAPEPNTLGAAYMVFASQDSHLVGALFMPQSSFDCFQGYRNGNELALQITNSYTQEVYGYAIALVADDTQFANAGDPDFELALDGFYRLDAPGESEMTLLSTCQAIYSTEL